MSVSLLSIEESLDARGLDYHLDTTEDLTSFRITSGNKEIEILDAVSGDSFKQEFLVEAILYGATTEDVTSRFEDVESVEEFLAAVAEVLS